VRLPQRVRDLWAEIVADEPYPLACLATVDELGARARTLVVRDFDSERGRVTFFCHRQHDKWEQLGRLGEICLYGGPRSTPYQLRLRCRLSLCDQDRAAWWQRLPSSHRLRLYKVDQAEVPDEFQPLCGHIVEVDLLDLRVPVRYGYVAEGPSYREELRPQ
jgi:hypothetical protein